ncbi:hypothetical protein D3C71_605840 [compost metagenome]
MANGAYEAVCVSCSLQDSACPTPTQPSPLEGEGFISLGSDMKKAAPERSDAAFCRLAMRRQCGEATGPSLSRPLVRAQAMAKTVSSR